MVLSNWDTLAVDENGNPTTGIFNDDDLEISIYKNYLRVTHGNSNIVVDSGILRIDDVKIVARRGPQEGVFVVVSKNDHKATTKAMVGCGVYGYNNHEWVGVSQESVKFLQEMLIEREDVNWDDYNFLTLEDRERILKESPDLAYHYSFEKEIRQINLDKALRFNQGDAYFANHLNADIPATEIGNQDDPLLNKLSK